MNIVSLLVFILIIVLVMIIAGIVMNVASFGCTFAAPRLRQVQRLAAVGPGVILFT